MKKNQQQKKEREAEKDRCKGATQSTRRTIAISFASSNNYTR
jgi:hypothetical protein